MVWSPGFWTLTPVRRRRVSMTAATTATVRMTAANSNGSRNSVNRLRASQVMLDVSAARAAALSAGKALTALPFTPIRISICTSMATATIRPTGR